MDSVAQNVAIVCRRCNGLAYTGLPVGGGVIVPEPCLDCTKAPGPDYMMVQTLAKKPKAT